MASADNPLSGFFTWDPTKTPYETDPGVAIYEVEAYQLIFNGVERTLGAGLFVFDSVDPFGTGTVDALTFGSVIQELESPRWDRLVSRVAALYPVLLQRSGYSAPSALSDSASRRNEM